MRASRQSKFSPASPRAVLRRIGGGGGALARRRLGEGAFTLIELIVVLTLLAIAATFVASSMGSFFHGRILNFEARRMLSLTRYAQSRAVSEGVPVLLWVKPADSTYGVTIQSSFSDPEGDLHAVQYTAESSLRLETPVGEVAPLSEQDDEKLGLQTDGLSFIRFTPDGFFDESGTSKITIREAAGALEIAPTANRLGFEIRPASDAN